MSQPGIDFRVVLVDTTGTALGTVGNPIFTSVTGAGSGGTSSIDESAFTAGASAFTPTGGAFNDAATALVAGQQGIVRSTTNRALHVNLRRPDGTEVVPASFPTDAAAWTTAVSTFDPVGGVFNDSAAALTAGQQGTLRLTANRATHANLRTAAGLEMGALTTNNAAPVNLSQIGVLPAVASAASPTYTEGFQTLLSTDLTGLLRVKAAGFQASGTAVASNPVLIGLNGSGTLVRYAVDAVAGFPTVGTGVTAVHSGCFDGTNFQKSLQVTQATANTGVGLPAAGPCLWDLVGTTNFVKQAGDGSGRAMAVGASAIGAAVAGNPVLMGLSGTGSLARYAVDAVLGFPTTGTGVAAVGPGVFDGTNFQKLLQVTQATATTGAGIAATGPLLFDSVGGTNYVKQAGNARGEAIVVAGGLSPAAPTCTFTRGANQTPYTIGDEVGTSGTAPTTVSVARFNGGSGVILGAQVVYSSYAATVPQLVVVLFSATTTLAGDNAQLNLSDGDAALCIGTIPLTASQSGQYSAGAAVAAGNTLFFGAPTAPIEFVAGGSQQTIYAAIITLNAFTPIANSETLILTLRTEQN